jgi:hypothetical protein
VEFLLDGGWHSVIYRIGFNGTNSADLLDINLSSNPAANSFSTTNISKSQLSLGFAPSTGVVRGKYRPAGTKISYPFYGLAADGSAWGFYLGTNHQTGPIMIGASLMPFGSRD